MYSYTLSSVAENPATVYLAATSSTNWPVALSTSAVTVPGNGTVEFQVKVQVPPMVALPPSLITVRTLSPTAATAGQAVAYLSLQPGSDPVPVPSQP